MMTSGDFVHNLVLRAAGLETLAFQPRFVPYFPARPDPGRRSVRGAEHSPKTPPPQIGDAQEMPAKAAEEAPPALAQLIQVAKSSPVRPEIRQTAIIQGARPEMKRQPEDAEGSRVDDGNQKPSRSGANASKPKSFEANETTKTGARADADAAPSEAASRGSQYAGPVKGGSVTANKSTEGHSIGGDALERVDDVRESVELYSSDDDSNAITIIESTEIARNASDDSAIQETRQSETLPDGSLLESPAPAKVLPVDHDFRRGKGDLDQSRSLEHQVKARYSGIGSSAAGSKAARPEVSSEEDQQGSGAMGKRKPEVQEKAAAVDDRQRPGHSAHLEEAGYFLIGPAEITPPIQPSNIPEKATPQVPGTVHVRIGTVEVHADASPPTPRSRPRPSGFEGYEMIRSYMSWEH